MNELEQLRRRVEELERTLKEFVRPDGYLFPRSLASRRESKLGLMGATPVSRFSDGIARSTVSGNTGTPASIGCQWNGESGSTYYSTGDIVRALKDYGLLEE